MIYRVSIFILKSTEKNYAKITIKNENRNLPKENNKDPKKR